MTTVALISHPALPSRFWAKVQAAADGCWLWTACLNSRGYACYSIKAKSFLAHRIAYEAMVAPIPVGLEIDHLCRTHRCVNPAHMEPVTKEENIRRGAPHRPTHRGPYRTNPKAAS